MGVDAFSWLFESYQARQGMYYVIMIIGAKKKLLSVRHLMLFLLLNLKKLGKQSH